MADNRGWTLARENLAGRNGRWFVAQPHVKEMGGFEIVEVVPASELEQAKRERDNARAAGQRFLDWVWGSDTFSPEERDMMLDEFRSALDADRSKRDPSERNDGKENSPASQKAVPQRPQRTERT